MVEDLGLGPDPKREEQEISGGWEEIWTIPGPGQYQIRFLVGPRRVKTVFYPSLEEDEFGELKPRYSAVQIDPRSDTTVVHALIRLDQSIRRKLGDPYSSDSAFSVRVRFLYGILLKEMETPEVKIGSFPYTVADELAKKQRIPHPKKSGFLMYGPWHLWDALVIRSEDPRKSKRYGTTYGVEVAPDYPLLGKVPVSWLARMPADFDYIGAGIFTQEELDMIREFVAARGAKSFRELLDEIGRPMTNEEIRDHFERYPINVRAMLDHSGHKVPAFPEPERYIEELSKLEVPFGEALEAPQAEEVDTQALVQQQEAAPQTVVGTGFGDLTGGGAADESGAIEEAF